MSQSVMTRKRQIEIDEKNISNSKTNTSVAQQRQHKQHGKERSQGRKRQRHATLQGGTPGTPMRRLVVPQSVQEIQQLDDMFEWNEESFLTVGLWKKRRPLPAVSSLATMPPTSNSTAHSTNVDRQKEQQQHEQRGLEMPLIQSFLRQLRVTNDSANSSTIQTHDAHENKDSDSKENQQEADRNNIVSLVDNPNLSTLSRGQHARFLQLVSEKQSLTARKWNDARKLEFQKLLKVVQREQNVYQMTLRRHLETNLKPIYKVGFVPKSELTDPSEGELFSSRVALLDSRRAKHYRDVWENNERTKHIEGFGKCIQTISIQQPIVDQAHISQLNQLESFISQNKVVHTITLSRENQNDSEASALAVLPSLDSTTIPVTLRNKNANTLFHNDNTVSQPTLLSSDVVAKRLAEEHMVDIVTSRETLQCLLDLSPSTSGSVKPWMIPVLSIKDASDRVWMEVPIPQASNPRQCLTRGYEIVLRQSLVMTHSLENKVDNNSESNSHPTKRPLQHVYSLLTLGGSSVRKSRNAYKVLVRSTNYLAIQRPTTPLCLHVHLDYFEGRQEEFTSHEKALWILDKMLQPTCQTVVGRICPHTARLLLWEETSIAHALAQQQNESTLDAGTSDSDARSDPMDNIQVMVQVLKSMASLERGVDQVLCWPSRQKSTCSEPTFASSISVHKRLDNSDGDGMDISVEKELQENGNLVYTGQNALRQCIQQLKWHDPSRVPFTFPNKEDSSRGESTSKET